MKTREELFEKLFLSFRMSLNFPKSEFPRQYLKSLGLDWTKQQIGFNSGQFHHRQSEEFKKPYIEHGILTESKSVNTKSPDLIPYKCFGSYGLIFPLYNKKGELCNFFARRIKLKCNNEEYLNQEGLFPHYPPLPTKRIFLVSTIIDAVSFIQAGVACNREAVLSLQNGKFLSQHQKAIESLPYLEQVIKINC
jgi:DNA primase